MSRRRRVGPSRQRWQVSSLHCSNEALEEVETVLRPRVGLGVILNTKSGPINELDPAIAAVEQRHVGLAHIFGKSLAFDRKAVIHAGNLDFAISKALHRVVGAAMPLEHLRRASANREGKHLMPETNAEQR